jgi:hypothetical protein
MHAHMPVEGIVAQGTDRLARSAARADRAQAQSKIEQAQKRRVDRYDFKHHGRDIAAPLGGCKRNAKEKAPNFAFGAFAVSAEAATPTRL